MELYTYSLNRHRNSRKSSHNFFFGSRSSNTEWRIYLHLIFLLGIPWLDLGGLVWKALNGWGKGNLFKLNKFIHTREARGTGVTAQSGGARPSPHFPGPRVSGRRHSRPVSGCAMSRDVSAPTQALAETMTTQLSSYSREGEMTFGEILTKETSTISVYQAAVTVSRRPQKWPRSHWLPAKGAMWPSTVPRILSP